MSSPLQFYRIFKSLMQEHGIRHVLTSGMACVEYGIQQITKTTEAAFQNARAGIADLMVVAQMKKTDRDKDWPMVEALSQQAAFRNDPRALLHSRDPELLASLWASSPAETRSALAQRRPLLNLLASGADPATLRRCLVIERAFWEEVNKRRYRRFQHEWKEFLRRWRKRDDFAWPVSLPFARQHQLVCQAVCDFGLPHDPLGGDAGRRAIFEEAETWIADLLDPGRQSLSIIMPPLVEVLP
jgi:hypothetical protein